IPTGRISVNTNEQLLSYLDKIKAFDAQQDPNSIYDFQNKDWQKQVLHFGGGTDQLQQTVFQAYLDQMENIIEDSLFAGNVTKLYKKSSDPFDPSQFNEITERLSKGVSLINFFGHANPATNGFEINIENPANWNNQGKYPLVIANTCLNGNIFHRETPNDFSTSERFVRAENSGAIAFISTVFLGFSSTLSNYTRGLYTEMSRSAYGQTLGNQIKRNLTVLQNFNSGDYLLESNALQMSLNGDPMIRINWHARPEIDVTENRLTFLPEKIDLTTDSIIVQLDIRNLGKSITDTFNVEIRRNFPQSNVDSIYFVRIPKLNYSHLLEFKMPIQPNIGIGVNQITLTLDLPSFYSEMYDEITNNQVTKTLFINIDGVQPVIPHKYAVVPTDSIVLKASTINPLATIKTYRFEIDTTDLFNSPFRRYQDITSSGGVLEAIPTNWKLVSNNAIAPIVFTDSTVCFWRVALQENPYNWKESSFQYIQGKRGWGQDHFFQFKENNYSQIQYLRSNREKLFDPSDTSFLEANVFSTAYSTLLNNWVINGEQQDYELCQNIPQIQVGVVDPLTMTAWETRYGGLNLDHSFGNYNDNGSCRPRVEKYFLFRQDNAGQLAAFQNMVKNEVPDGHYLVIYFPRFGPRYDNWDAIDSAGMFGTLTQLGFDAVKATNSITMTALFVKKGDPSTAIQVFGTDFNDPVHLRAPMVGVSSTGQETSTLIGPASKWNSFFWNLTPYQGLNNDTTFLEIEQFNANQQYQSKIQVAIAASDSILNLNNLVDAQVSPYIKVRAIYQDSVNTTPAQLQRWHVLYDELPEAAIDAKNGYLWTGNALDTIEEGKNLFFSVDVRNIYDIPMDSLLISYWIEDDNHFKKFIDYPRQDSLRIGETIRDTLLISTLGLTGNNIFWMEVNPYNTSTGILDQPEQLHFNNLLQIPFSVRGDRINPLLDVTFDGRHILNGDIVNPNSEIVISLKDENLLKVMDSDLDTNLFGIYLTAPGKQPVRIPFVENGQNVMQWIPADPGTKKFKIIYPAKFLEDGKYTLSVQGSDKSGNLSGDMDYRITFEVIRESSITYMMNYPNPFSTSTRFVFTLTGTEVPDEMIIQIMTVSGRVIREITEDQFGPIFIGRNISQYAWDGTDEFGDRLANGVYLYRVKMQIAGEDIKHRDSGADSHFTKEFGKMYLMR
ncbi:MAG: hypothetical protein KJ941_01455, partial [Bacteroidetes bacterium]|nr:hypothetical protein [Bacteroidota bacterium]